MDARYDVTIAARSADAQVGPKLSHFRLDQPSTQIHRLDEHVKISHNGTE